MLIEKELFNKWACKYENDIHALKDVYPFAGYFDVIVHIRKTLLPMPTASVLDLGVGTGLMLSEIIKGNDYSFRGCDFSDEMVNYAQNRLNSDAIFEHDIRKAEAPDQITETKFDCIYSAYTFHHFELPKKIEIIQTYLPFLKTTGHFLIADISFENESELQKVKSEVGDRWDADEEMGYWRRDEFMDALKKHNLKATYTKISFCAGIYHIQPI
ncbi:MAG: methyltransferase domain-containing protein [Crocinitomix sp.]|nr:methyltransferase domain-containing protein [Crocinitomix sp.]